MAEAPERIAKLMEELEALREREAEINRELIQWVTVVEDALRHIRMQVSGHASQEKLATHTAQAHGRKKRKKLTQKALIVGIVTDSEKPLRADAVHKALGDAGHEMDLRNVRSYLAHAAKEGLVARIEPGLYGPKGSAPKSLLDGSD